MMFLYDSNHVPINESISIEMVMEFRFTYVSICAYMLGHSQNVDIVYVANTITSSYLF